MTLLLCLLGSTLVITTVYNFTRSWDAWALNLPEMHYLNFLAIDDDEQERF